MNKEKFQSLDGLKAFSALLIVAAHVVFEPEYSIYSDSVSNGIIFFGQLVYLFMILSAFGMCCGYYERFKNKNVNLDSFYKRRYVRILPFFAILVFIELSYTFLRQHFSLNETMFGAIKESIANLTLAFGLLPNAHHIGIVGVGWFLGLVFVFYMLFPFFVFLLDNKKRAWKVLGICIGLSWLASSYFSTPEWVVSPNWRDNILVSSPYFIGGGILYLYRFELQSIKGKAHKALGALITGYAVLFFWNHLYLYQICVAILLFLCSIYAISQNGKGILNNRIVSFLSGISFEIYLCHMMFLRVIELLHLERYIHDRNMLTIITYGLVIALSIAFSATYKKLERKLIHK